ncbi:MAG: hypothetical protein WBA45_02630 [Microthrixaceae bacterium]
MNVLYIASAVIGFALLAVGLLVDDLVDGIELAPDWASIPVLGAGLGAFGIAGWATGSLGAGAAAAAVVAVLAALLFAVGAFWFAAKVRDGATDATPRASDTVGLTARVITPVAGGRGEVLLRIGGQPRKLTAISESDLELGEQVVVIESISDSAVRVITQHEFWGTSEADSLAPASPELDISDPMVPEAAVQEPTTEEDN